MRIASTAQRKASGSNGLKNPPLNWYALFAGREAGAWMTIHRFHAQQTIRAADSFAAKVRLLCSTLIWPVTATFQAMHRTEKYGEFVRERTGKLQVTQFVEQLQLIFFECISPKSYYLFQLYEPERRKRAQEYLHRYESKRPSRLYHAISAEGPGPSRLLCDKMAFHERCQSAGIATPEIYMSIEDGQLKNGSSSDRLPTRDLFVKPCKGRGGRGTQAWRFTSLGDFVDIDGIRMGRDQLLDKLIRDSHGTMLLVQQRAENHGALAWQNGHATSTARVMSVVNERGEPEVVAAVFRMASGRTIVDNIHRGGIAAGIDLATGKLDSAIALGPEAIRTDLHPETQRTFRGKTLPNWAEALALVVRAHRAFDGRCVIGWDVAFTPLGPVLIEGNSAPCVHLMQRGMDRPLGAGRFAELLAYHLKKRNLVTLARPKLLASAKPVTTH
ncbi:MAG: hypothetical protein ACI9QQ_002597 [Myxococcota bacterium]|jgi:hypothetical protein